MITTCTVARDMNVGDKYFEPGVGVFLIYGLRSGRTTVGSKIMLMEVSPVGKNKSAGGRTWHPSMTILHKVTG